MSDVDAVAARRFIEEAERELRFLHDDFGFDGPLVGQGPFAVWVTFKGVPTALKASFDTLDRVVEVFIVKLIDGELPAYDETESTHYVGPRSLAAVAGGGLPAHELRLRSLSGEEFRRVLGRSAEVVREFDDVLRGDFRRFDQAIAENRVHVARLEAAYQRELREEVAHRRRGGFSRWLRRRRGDPSS